MLPLRFFAEFSFESSVESQQVGIFRYELVAVKKIEFKLFMSCNLFISGLISKKKNQAVSVLQS